MIKEAIDRILALAIPNSVTQDGLLYVDKSMHLMKPPMADPIAVETLQGLVDLLNAPVDGLTAEDVMVHVVSSTEVRVASLDADQYGRRRVYVKCEYPRNVQPFPFGQWLDPEKFVIGCQAGFQRAKIETAEGKSIADLDYVLRVASTITAEAAHTSEDDGISQQVAVRKGVSLKEGIKLTPIVKLAPYRTFADINQVVSTFVLRVRADGANIHLSLTEADGGRWHIDAVKEIAAWLKGKVGKTQIIK